MTKTQRVYQELVGAAKDGGLITADIIQEFGYPSATASAILHNLVKQGRAMIVGTQKITGFNRPCNIFIRTDEKEDYYNEHIGSSGPS